VSETGPRTGGWLGRLERLGNALPDPMTLFAGGAVVVFVLSTLAAWAGWSVTVRDTKGVETLYTARGLLTAEGLRWLFLELVPIFAGFRPLGLVLAASIGVAVAERSGLIGAGLKAMLVVVPRSLLAPVTVLSGVLSSLGADAGFVVLPPLAAATWKALGRSPKLGIATVTAGIAGGFGANLVPTSLDPLLAGMTEEAARLFEPGYAVAATCNWTFMIASTVLLTLVGWFVCERVLAPRMEGAGASDPGQRPALEPAERRGLRAALVTGLVLAGLLGWAVASEHGFLHDVEPGATPLWIRSIVALIVVGFFAPGLAYGLAAGTIRSDRDVARMLTEYFALMANYVVLVFFASILVAAFERSNLGVLLAVNGGRALQALALPTGLLLAAFALLCGVTNLLVVSSSAKWAMLATIFVPLFMTLGVSPEMTQLAYRVGDSLTNPISPLNMYLVIVLTFLRREDATSGLGTLIASLVPFSLAFALTWIPLLLLFWGLDLPIGPDTALTYPGH
jgi:aminobenzoyl-glutamate transport protein